MSRVIPQQSERLMRCPTCRAEQSWSDECRRCKCDLTLLRDVWQFATRLRSQCLVSLRAGRYEQALSRAQQLVRLDPTEEARRLVAVCHLYCGNYRQAVALARLASGA